jgi:hypothetical protein
VLEEAIPALVFDCLDVALANRKQARVGLHDSGVWAARLRWQRWVYELRHLDEVVEAVANREQAGVKGEIAVGLDDLQEASGSSVG